MQNSSLQAAEMERELAKPEATSDNCGLVVSVRLFHLVTLLERDVENIYYGIYLVCKMLN